MDHIEAVTTPERGEAGQVTMSTIAYCADLLSVSPAALTLFLVGEGS